MVSDHELLHSYPNTESNTSTGMIWVTLNMPSAVEECHEPSGNCQGMSHCLESGHPDWYFYSEPVWLFLRCCDLQSVAVDWRSYTTVEQLLTCSITNSARLLSTSLTLRFSISSIFSVVVTIETFVRRQWQQSNSVSRCWWAALVQYGWTMWKGRLSDSFWAVTSEGKLCEEVTCSILSESSN